MPAVRERRPQVLAVGAAGVDYGIRAGRDRSAAQHRRLVAALDEPFGEAVDEDFGSAGLRVGEVAPGEEQDAHQAAVLSRTTRQFQVATSRRAGTRRIQRWDG